MGGREPRADRRVRVSAARRSRTRPCLGRIRLLLGSRAPCAPCGARRRCDGRLRGAHLRRRSAGELPAVRGGDRPSHLLHRVRFVARDIEHTSSRRFDRLDIRSSDIAHVHEVADLRPVFEHRRGAASGEGAAEDRCDSGVRCVARHPWAVHVVIPERGNRQIVFPPVGITEMLLMQLGRCVQVAWIGRRVFGDLFRHDVQPHRGHRGSKRPASRSSALRGSGRTDPCS